MDDIIKKRKRIVIIVIVIVLVAAALIGSLAYRRVTEDPNYMIKHSAKRIKEGQTEAVSYDYGHPVFLADKRIPIYMFTPAEDGEYIFEISGITTETDDYLLMSVTDRKFAEYLGANNIPGEGDETDGDSEDGSQNSISDETFLQKGHRYYIFVDASSGESLHKGSFSISVNRSPEEIKPEEITPGQKTRITVKKGEQTSLIFVPDETAYYKFKSEIVSKNAATGFSSISDVTSDDGDTLISVTDGICRLEAGSEYYIQVTAEDIKGGSAKIDVWCRMIAETSFDESGMAEPDSRTMIDYTADRSGRVLIHSESEGDPKVYVYDSEGMPIRTDDDSGAEFGGSDKDFAVMFDVEKDEVYHVYVSGKMKKCRVFVSALEQEPEENAELLNDAGNSENSGENNIENSNVSNPELTSE